jgi:hypothetical protein
MAAHAHLSINVLTIPMTAKTSVPVVTPMPILQIMIATVQGYSGNGLTCLAINYCTEDTHGCSDACNVTGPDTFDCLCTDLLATLSGKTCICPNGDSGNGRNCTGNHIFPTFKFIFIFLFYGDYFNNCVFFFFTFFVFFIYPSLKKFLMYGKILFLMGNLLGSSMQIILNGRKNLFQKNFTHKKKFTK